MVMSTSSAPSMVRSSSPSAKAMGLTGIPTWMQCFLALTLYVLEAYDRCEMRGCTLVGYYYYYHDAKH